MSSKARRKMNALALMNLVDDGGGEQEAFDPTTFLAIFNMVQDLFGKFCGASGASLKSQSARIKNPTRADKKRLMSFNKIAARRTIRRGDNPTGERVSGKELKQLRADYAQEAYDASLAAGQEASLKDRKALATDWRA